MAFCNVLDTLNGNIRIHQQDSVLFEIPINSIELDAPKFNIDLKLGSAHYKIRNSVKSSVNVTYLSSEKITVMDDQNTFTISTRNGDIVKIHSSSGYCKLSILKELTEKFYGGGTQFSNTELTQNKLVNICEENGIGRGDNHISKWSKIVGIKGEPYSTYYPIPFIVSSKNRGISIDLPLGLHIIEVKQSTVEVSLFSAQNELRLFKEDSMIEVIQKFSTHNGRGQDIPNWALGGIIGVQGGTKTVIEKLNPFLDHETPISGIWIQDWVGKRETNIGSRLNWIWKLDSTYAGIFDFADDHNLKVLGYINPFFAEFGEYTREGISKKYFVLNDGKSTEFDFGGMKGYMVDLFNPKAYSWMKTIIKDNLIKNGFDGWMADFAEWYPVNQLSEIENHNLYAHLWIKLNHEVRNEHDQELFIFHRSGTVGTAKYSQATWCGDQMTNFGNNDGLPSAINAIITSGLSGLPITHSDIGGYTSVNKPIIRKILRTEQLLNDWIKLEAFTPFFRSHEGLLPDIDLQIYSTRNTIEFYHRYAKINHALIPYFAALISDYQNHGTPIIRHPILMNEDFGDYAFYVGNDIFIKYDINQKEINIPNGFEPVLNHEQDSRIHIGIRKDSEILLLLNSMY